MIKKITAVFMLAAFVFTGAVNFYAFEKNDKEILTELLNEFLAGVDNAETHDKFWAEDLIYTRGSGERTDKASIMKGMRSSSSQPARENAPVTTYSAEELQINVYGNAAVVAFKLVGTTKRGEVITTQKFYNTGTFIKREGRWQAVAWQATPAK